MACNAKFRLLDSIKNSTNREPSQTSRPMGTRLPDQCSHCSSAHDPDLVLGDCKPHGVASEAPLPPMPASPRHEGGKRKGYNKKKKKKKEKEEEQEGGGNASAGGKDIRRLRRQFAKHLERSAGTAKALRAVPKQLRRDAAFVAQAVARNVKCFRLAAPELRTSPAFLEELVKQDPNALPLLDLDCASFDRELVLRIVRREPQLISLFRATRFSADREVLLEATKLDPASLLHASHELRGSKDFVAACCEHQPAALQHAGENLKGDLDFIREAVKRSPAAFAYVDETWRACREIAWEAVSRNHGMLKLVSADLKGDAELVRAAVLQASRALADASTALRNDGAFLLTLLRERPEILKLLPSDAPILQCKEFALDAVTVDAASYFDLPSHRDDFDVALRAMNSRPDVFYHLPEALRARREVALAVCARDGTFLEEVPQSFRDDKDVVLAAVASYGLALWDASRRLRDDKEVVLAACRSCGQALEAASDTLKRDRDVAREAVANDGSSIVHAHMTLQLDRELALEAVAQNGKAWSLLIPLLKLDRTIALRAVKTDGEALADATTRMRADEALVTAALESNALGAWPYVAKELQEDRRIACLACRQDGHIYEHICPEFQADPDVALAALETCPSLFYSLPEALQRDRAVLRWAIRNLGYYSADFEDDVDLALEAVEHCPANYKKLPYHIRKNGFFIQAVLCKATADAAAKDCEDLVDRPLRKRIFKRAAELAGIPVDEARELGLWEAHARVFMYPSLEAKAFEGEGFRAELTYAACPLCTEAANAGASDSRSILACLRDHQ